MKLVAKIVKIKRENNYFFEKMAKLGKTNSRNVNKFLKKRDMTIDKLKTNF